MLKVGIWVESFRCAGILIFAMARWKFSASTIFEILPLSTFTLCQQKPVSPKVFNRFSKSLPQLEDVEGGHLGGKCQLRRCFIFATASWKRCASTSFEISHFQPVHRIFAVTVNRLKVAKFQMLSMRNVFTMPRYFTFAMAWWKLCASTTFEILPLSTFSLSQQKSHISKGIQPIFEIFAWARRCWGWAFGWKVSAAQVFYFCNGMVKTLRIDNIWNFATFNLFTVTAKILYLQRYSTDFRILFLS